MTVAGTSRYRRLRYGPDDSQVADVHEPLEAARGMAVLVHGGFWRARFSLSLMADLAVSFVSHRWVAVNIEYRRIGEGGRWPEILHDVRTAIEHARDQLPDYRHLPSAAVGHSAGAQLALLAADLVDAVVALAPVTDLVRCERDGLGGGAAAELMCGSSVERQREYRDASPIEHVPLRRPLLIVHGDVDSRVPVAQSRDYVRRAADAGDRVDYLELPGVTHRQLTDPGQDHWAWIFDWLSQR